MGKLYPSTGICSFYDSIRLECVWIHNSNDCKEQIGCHHEALKRKCENIIQVNSKIYFDDLFEMTFKERFVKERFLKII